VITCSLKRSKSALVERHHGKQYGFPRKNSSENYSSPHKAEIGYYLRALHGDWFVLRVLSVIAEDIRAHTSALVKAAALTSNTKTEPAN